MAELFANLARTTLTANIDSVVVTFSVASVALFPATGNFRIVIDTEIMLVTSVNVGANQFTVTRAAEGPYAASTHLAGASVVHILTKASLATIGGATSPLPIPFSFQSGNLNDAKQPANTVVGFNVHTNITSAGANTIVSGMSVSGLLTAAVANGYLFGISTWSGTLGGGIDGILFDAPGFDNTTTSASIALGNTNIVGGTWFYTDCWIYPSVSGTRSVSALFIGNSAKPPSSVVTTPTAIWAIYSTYPYPSALSGGLYLGTPANANQNVSAIFAGTGVPSNANGNNGDIYFNGAGGAGTTIYQKRAGAWVGIV